MHANSTKGVLPVNAIITNLVEYNGLHLRDFTKIVNHPWELTACVNVWFKSDTDVMPGALLTFVIDLFMFYNEF